MIKVYTNAGLKPLNTFKMDGTCDRLITFSTIADLHEIGSGMLDFNHDKWMCIGGGSNILFTSDFHGTLLMCTDDRVSLEPAGHVSVGSGCVLDKFVEQMCHAGCAGVERLSGIPGTIGGAIVQNAGAYRQEIADCMIDVTVFDTHTLRAINLSKSECRMGYRSSLFKTAEGIRLIILNARFAFTAREGLEAERADILGQRNAKLPDPQQIGSAGSFFKNPVITSQEFSTLLSRYADMPHYPEPDGRIKIPAAWLIDQCGLKGHKHGQASVWHRQPLVITNSTGHAPAADILGLEQIVAERVKDKFDINLQPEVIHCK